MGKILTICRNCLLSGTEPDIDYDLLKSKHLYLLGKEVNFYIIMGYNGSNRKGHDVGYRGFKKSSFSVGNRLFDTTTRAGLLLGRKAFSNIPSTNDVLMGLASADFSRTEEQKTTNLTQKGLTIIVILLLILAPLFQWLCYHAYSWWDWYPFFAFLFFGTISFGCIGLAEHLLGTTKDVSKKRGLFLGYTIFAMYIANVLMGLWVFWLVELDDFVFVHGLVIIQDIVSMIILLYLYQTIKGFKQIR